MTTVNYPSNINSWRFVEVYGTDFRPCLIDMANTANRLELWGWFREEDPPKDDGYIFWDHPNVKKISDGLEVNEHSGATFCYCMRQMQYIAINGFEKWNNPPQPE